MFYDLDCNTNSYSSEKKTHMEDFILNQVHLYRILTKYPTQCFFPAPKPSLLFQQYYSLVIEIRKTETQTVLIRNSHRFRQNLLDFV